MNSTVIQLKVEGGEMENGERASFSEPDTEHFQREAGTRAMEGFEDDPVPSPASSFVPDSPSRPYEFWDSEDEGENKNGKTIPGRESKKADLLLTWPFTKINPRESESLVIATDLVSSDEDDVSAERQTPSIARDKINRDNQTCPSPTQILSGLPASTPDFSTPGPSSKAGTTSAENIWEFSKLTSQTPEIEIVHFIEIFDIPKPSNETKHELKLDWSGELPREFGGAYFTLPIPPQEYVTVLVDAQENKFGISELESENCSQNLVIQELKTRVPTLVDLVSDAENEENGNLEKYIICNSQSKVDTKELLLKHSITFNCETCSAILFSRDGLEKHGKLHESGEGHLCAQCGWLVPNLPCHESNWHR